MRLKRTVATRRWASSLVALALSGVLGATIAWWALQLFAPPIAIAPPGSLADQHGAPDLTASARLFGEPVGTRTASAPAAMANIQVLGVAASTVRASAVIAVDGKPARAYMVGDAVTTDARLIEVRADRAIVEQRGARVELVAPQRPSVDVLWSGPAQHDRAEAARPPVPAAAAPAAAAPATPVPSFGGARASGGVPPGTAPPAAAAPPGSAPVNGASVAGTPAAGAPVAGAPAAGQPGVPAEAPPEGEAAPAAGGS